MIYLVELGVALMSFGRAISLWPDPFWLSVYCTIGGAAMTACVIMFFVDRAHA